jgi:DEAD/DEAH box helicase domain-containing protein
MTTELLLTYLRRSAEQRGELPERIRGYRGGYLPHERRAIERGLREGRVRGVVSTNALELGVDIGELSVCVLAGYPGSIASTWQQAGRAGRRQDVSLAVLVAGPSALDQYLLSHPQFFFSRTPEQALVAPDNPYLLREQLKCAAFELPLGEHESLSPNLDTIPLAEDIASREGVLRQSRGRWYWMSSRYPAQDVSLRTASSDNLSVVQATSGQAIGQIDRPSAPLLIHPGAVYLHEGQPYLIEQLDMQQRMARARPTQVEYFTEASQSVQVEVLRVAASEAASATARGHGDVRVRSQVTQFRQLAWYTHELLATLPLELPEQELLTSAYWLGLQPALVNSLRDQGDWTIAPILSYGPNWDEQRRRTRERDEFRCRHCGRSEAPGREHDVHHLRPFRTFDYRPGCNENYLAANALANLVTLCPDCHRRLETAHETQGTLDGLAHLLHALAPLHLMCDPRDLGVSAELDFSFTRMPTVVIYDALPGGVGFSAALYALQDEQLHASLDWLTRCPCDEGCPACIGAPPEPGLGAKRRVAELLRRVVVKSAA